jgi:GNAT superfamily N-acetyltransferase
MAVELRKSDLYRVTCRPALPRDTAEVMELTRTIWGGHDYVPFVWAEWLADPQGLLAAAEYGGRVVGVGKLSLLSADEWWLQGLRVHPEFQGRGIASRLHDYMLAYWQRNRGAVLRLATARKSSSTCAAHRLPQSASFRPGAGSSSRAQAPRPASAPWTRREWAPHKPFMQARPYPLLG